MVRGQGPDTAWFTDLAGNILSVLEDDLSWSDVDATSGAGR